jgi:hypothetical protein
MYNSGNLPMISSCGTVLPCCYARSAYHFDEFLAFVGYEDERKKINLNYTSFNDIEKSSAYQRLRESFESSPLEMCIKHCSNKDQYINSYIYNES